MSHYEYEGRDPGYGVDTSWHHQEPGSHIDADISGYTHSNAEYDDPIEVSPHHIFIKWLRRLQINFRYFLSRT